MRQLWSKSPIPNAIFAARRLQLRSLFSTYPARAVKQLPPRPKLDDKDITGSYLKGTGPGGQKINKTNSAVQLIHKPTGIVVKSQATRSRSQNQKIAREILAAKVEELEKGEQSREAIKNALKRKRKASSMKKKRRKYRALEEAKQGQQLQDGAEEYEECASDYEESTTPATATR
ncbi:peptidyl-tRNA hydrolase domain protein [Talaromyces stipitatus ATCC 10500]|uniref:Peptidyl-tRNA hydrolase domain protein n=1 Tax=Talaromyces stipitatus (strain ATCC 10500 / CBS 375.48 / QM 6759 / NRRL 1006) TaxID=441959 RepID=B8M6D8_TALSN|nr:peptidyl-tRNA hydrolase domain protein [Talaromyces stipitatus ATCC 10500]EED19313.1 peptidyl-tRNA hydrolase domain protein [Talaromyces stipitatus ATCC 10500]